jgi:death-on-curing protein
MSVQCLDLADFLLIAESITGIEAEALTRLPRLHTADHALSAPNAGIGETAYYATFADKAAAMTYQLIKGHPLVDGNKRAGYVCLLEFVIDQHSN